MKVQTIKFCLVSVKYRKNVFLHCYSLFYWLLFFKKTKTNVKMCLCKTIPMHFIHSSRRSCEIINRNDLFCNTLLFSLNVLPVVLLCWCGLLRQAVDQHRVVGVNVKTALFHSAWVSLKIGITRGRKKKHFLGSAFVLSRNLRNQIVDAQKIKKRRKKKTIIHATFAFWL